MKAVVIGNGVSLRDHLHLGHFDLLTEKGIDSWAMNLIDMLYDPDPEHDLPGTDWRPTFWTWVEYVGYSREDQPWTRTEYYDNVLDRHVHPQIEKCFIDYRFKRVLGRRVEKGRMDDRPKMMREAESPVLPNMRAPTDHLIWIERCDGFHGVQTDNHRKPTDWHLPLPCVYGGTMNTVLSLVFMYGYTDVGVIGCDLGIREPDKGHDYNHFRDDYFTYLDGQFDLQDDTLRDVHTIAKMNFDRTGRRIVNVGINGELDIYDRMTFEEWIND